MAQVSVLLVDIVSAMAEIVRMAAGPALWRRGSRSRWGVWSDRGHGPGPSEQSAQAAVGRGRDPRDRSGLRADIGVTGRLLARESLEAPVDEHDRLRLGQAWRRFEQAAKALDNADEAEDFQAVGMRCRECLVTFLMWTPRRTCS
jgi:hypothetical protein